MPNWCANRIEIVAPACKLTEVEAWANGTMFPYHQRAIQQSIRLFLTGVAGRLKPAGVMHYAAYPALTAHGAGIDTPATRAFGEWLTLLQQDALLDEETSATIDRYYRLCGMAALKWDMLTVEEQGVMEAIIRTKRNDWARAGLYGLASDEMFDALDAEQDGETFDLRLIRPTQLACEINGFNGRLLEGVRSTYSFYVDHYGTKWPSGISVKISRENHWLCLDVDTAWAPPEEHVLEALSARWECTVHHYYSEAGCDFCGYREYENGELTDCIDGSLEYGDEDEDGYSDVSGPEWLLDNVPHYGG